MTLFAVRTGPIAGDYRLNIEWPHGQKPVELGRRTYMFLELIKSHRPMLLFLQQKHAVLDMSNAEYRDRLVAEVKKSFPNINKKCPGCGVKPNDYSLHLQDIVSIHHIGGKNLERIRLSGEARCFQYWNQTHGAWLGFEEATALRKLAGFGS